MSMLPLPSGQMTGGWAGNALIRREGDIIHVGGGGGGSHSGITMSSSERAHPLLHFEIAVQRLTRERQ